MNGPALQQRCWNHDEREAACRCPRCGRGFCRECVTEHEARLVCAACLKILAAEKQSRRGSLRRFLPASMALTGFVIAWFVFYGIGEALLESAAHLEQSTWQSH